MKLMLSLTCDKLGVQRCRDWQIDYIYNIVDSDNSGDISFDEFIKHYFQISEELRKCPPVKQSKRVEKAQNQMNTKKGIMVMNDEEREGFLNAFKDLINQIKNLEIKKLNQKKIYENEEESRSDHGTGLDKLTKTFKQEGNKMLCAVSNQLNDIPRKSEMDVEDKKYIKKSKLANDIKFLNSKINTKHEMRNSSVNQVEKNIFDISIIPEYKKIHNTNDIDSDYLSSFNDNDNNSTSQILETSNNCTTENIDKNELLKASAQKTINSVLLEGKSLRRFQKKKFDSFRPIEDFLKTEYQCNEGRSGYFKDFSLQELDKTKQNVESLKIWITSIQNLITHFQNEEQKFVQKHFSTNDNLASKSKDNKKLANENLGKSKSQTKLFTVSSNKKAFLWSKQDININYQSKQDLNSNLTWNLSPKEPVTTLQNLDCLNEEKSPNKLSMNKSDFFINSNMNNTYAVSNSSLSKKYATFNQKKLTQSKINIQSHDNLDLQMSKKKNRKCYRTETNPFQKADDVFFFS